jgi:hypothetical protein
MTGCEQGVPMGEWGGVMSAKWLQGLQWASGMRMHTAEHCREGCSMASVRWRGPICHRSNRCTPRVRAVSMVGPTCQRSLLWTWTPCSAPSEPSQMARSASPAAAHAVRALLPPACESQKATQSGPSKKSKNVRKLRVRACPRRSQSHPRPRRRGGRRNP